MQVGERPTILARPAGWLATLLGLICACSGPQRSVEIQFVARFAERPLGCATAAGDYRLTDLRLFVHAFRLRTAEGVEVPVLLADRSPWQGAQVALLDFEDGTGACRNGSAALNTVVQGSVPPGQYTGLAFRIGVPEALNHADPLQAPPPLNLSSMHWHWLTGYKFLRAGLAHRDDSFWIHLGSTRCAGAATRTYGCKSANRPEVALPAFDPGQSVVVLDLAALAAAVDLADGRPSDCSSGPAEAGCERPFAALGLDFASGAPIGTPPFVRAADRK